MGYTGNSSGLISRCKFSALLEIAILGGASWSGPGGLRLLELSLDATDTICGTGVRIMGNECMNGTGH